MATKIKLKRKLNKKTVISELPLDQGEPLFDTSTNTLYVGHEDGKTDKGVRVDTSRALDIEYINDDENDLATINFSNVNVPQESWNGYVYVGHRWSGGATSPKIQRYLFRTADSNSAEIGCKDIYCTTVHGSADYPTGFTSRETPGGNNPWWNRGKDNPLANGTLITDWRYKTDATENNPADIALVQTASGENGAMNIVLDGDVFVHGGGESWHRVATEDGNIATATKLLKACNLQVSLGSTSATLFDGSADVTNIGVSGTLQVANGGTGKTKLADVNGVGSAQHLEIVESNEIRFVRPSTWSKNGNLLLGRTWSDCEGEDLTIDTYIFNNGDSNGGLAKIQFNNATGNLTGTATNATKIHISGDDSIAGNYALSLSGTTLTLEKKND